MHKVIMRKLKAMPHRTRQLLDNWRKQRMVIAYQGRGGQRILVETGTYEGTMVAAMLQRFDAIYSVELGADLYARAAARFSAYPQVHLFQGDSGAVLPDVIKRLPAASIYWLDAHYSGGITACGEEETPIFKEVGAIFEHDQFNSTILIDDARLFDGTNDYPKLETLKQWILRRKPDLNWKVSKDIIQIWHGPHS